LVDSLSRRRTNSSSRQRVEQARKSLIKGPLEAAPPTQQTQPHFQPGRVQNTRIREQLEQTRSVGRTGFLNSGLELSRSSSFTKFQKAFEMGNVRDISDSDDSDIESTSRDAIKQIEIIIFNQ
jgi:hypothetical protein